MGAALALLRPLLPSLLAKMINDEGVTVDLYIPRKW